MVWRISKGSERENDTEAAEDTEEECKVKSQLAGFRCAEPISYPKPGQAFSGFGFETRKPTRVGFPGGGTFMTLQTS